MSLEELGRTLTHARNARGLSLSDAERDTRISSKYLAALEAGRVETLPAPVYARAFMRTYAQYLGLSARDFVIELPGAKPEVELPPLPDIASGVERPLIPVNWIVAGLIVALVLAAGVILFLRRGGESDVTSSAARPTVARPSGSGAEQLPQQQPEAPLQVIAGQGIPDLRGRPALAAVKALQDAGMRFVIIEVKNGDVPASTVFQQSPSPGTSLDEGALVTLVASR